MGKLIETQLDLPLSDGRDTYSDHLLTDELDYSIDFEALSREYIIAEYTVSEDTKYFEMFKQAEDKFSPVGMSRITKQSVLMLLRKGSDTTGAKVHTNFKKITHLLPRLFLMSWATEFRKTKDGKRAELNIDRKLYYPVDTKDKDGVTEEIICLSPEIHTQVSERFETKVYLKINVVTFTDEALLTYLSAEKLKAMPKFYFMGGFAIKHKKSDGNKKPEAKAWLRKKRKFSDRNMIDALDFSDDNLQSLAASKTGFFKLVLDQMNKVFGHIIQLKLKTRPGKRYPLTGTQVKKFQDKKLATVPKNIKVYFYDPEADSSTMTWITKALYEKRPALEITDDPAIADVLYLPDADYFLRRNAKDPYNVKKAASQVINEPTDPRKRIHKIRDAQRIVEVVMSELAVKNELANRQLGTYRLDAGGSAESYYNLTAYYKVKRRAFKDDEDNEVVIHETIIVRMEIDENGKFDIGACEVIGPLEEANPSCEIPEEDLPFEVVDIFTDHDGEYSNAILQIIKDDNHYIFENSPISGLADPDLIFDALANTKPQIPSTAVIEVIQALYDVDISSLVIRNDVLTKKGYNALLGKAVEEGKIQKGNKKTITEALEKRGIQAVSGLKRKDGPVKEGFYSFFIDEDFQTIHSSALGPIKDKIAVFGSVYKLSLEVGEKPSPAFVKGLFEDYSIKSGRLSSTPFFVKLMSEYYQLLHFPSDPEIGELIER